MSDPATVGIGVLGVGFMGRVHLRAIADAAAAGWPCRIAGVCDRKAERLKGRPPSQGNLGDDEDARTLFDADRVHATTDPRALLADPEVHAVSICTRTDTHMALALAALEAGKHVLVEKPVALATEEVRRLRDAAAATDRVCMPAMCMRFWPGWTWLLEAAADRRFGRLRSAVFRRLGCRPDWAPGFYDDPARSGGALTDLHIHDADFVRALLGDPAAVSSTGSLDHVTTLYHYPGGPHVVAEGGWDHAPGFGFRMTYVAVFDDATADFDLGRAEPLRLTTEGATAPVALPQGAGYDGELRQFVDLVSGRAPGPAVTLDDALALSRLLDAERESLARGATVALAP